MDRINKYFQAVCKRPLMYAGYREAFVAILATILNITGKPGNELYALFPHNGANVLTLNDRLDDEFAKTVIEKAQQLWNE